MRVYDYNNDFFDYIDQNIFSPKVCEAYKEGEKYEWIVKVEDEFLRDGLKKLNKKQLAIIEALYFEGKSILDICNKYCLSQDEVFCEIRDMGREIIGYM